MNRWFLDENDIDIYLKCTDDVRWHYNTKELVRILNDIESKLAESEKESNARYNAWQEEIRESDRLRVILAEKNKELERYAELFGMKDKDFYVVEKLEYEKMKQGAKDIVDELKQQLAEKEKDLIIKCRTIGVLVEKNEKNNQDKISFAVEQLEKVKEKINDCPITDYDTNKHFVKMYQRDAIRQLDNQIKAIKEMG